MSHSQIELEKPDKLRVLVVDDDRLSSHNLSIQLKFVGEVPLVTSSENWMQLVRKLAERGETRNILAIAIGQIQKTNVIDLLQEVHRHSPQVPLLLMTTLEEVQYSLLPENLQARLLPLGDGALNYERLLTALNTARQMTGRVMTALPSTLISDTGTAMFRSLSGQSRQIQKVRHLLDQIARRKITVLVTGESGTGKEIVARNLHYHSGRGDFPFIAVNCAAIDPGRHGAELFGQQKGYAGARDNLPGLIEQVDGGTLFLDEIAELPLNIQALLLRFLEDGRYQRLGGHDDQVSDVRLVVATRQNLEDNIGLGKFREDLYYRLSVMPVDLPSLRQRLDDIPELIKELVERLNQKETTTLRFNPSAILSLQQHVWPGNVRELANLVERLSIINPDAVIDIDDLPPQYRYDISAAAEHAANPELSPEDATVRRLPSPAQQKNTGLKLHNGNLADSLKQSASAHPSVDDDTRDSGKDAEQRPAPVSLFQNKTRNPPLNGLQESDSAFADRPDNNAQAHFQRTSQGSSQDDSGRSFQNGEPAQQKAPGSRATSRPSPAQKIEISPSADLDEQSLQQYLDRFARQMLEVALDDCAGLLPFTAERLHMDSNTLQARMQQYGLKAAMGR